MHYRPSSFSLLPPVVKNLLILNVLFYLAKISLTRFDIDLDQILGLHYFGSEAFKPYQLITHMFMHGNFMHLLSNMIGLYFFGYMLENFWGPKRFFVYYLITGFGASMLHYGVFYIENFNLIHALNNYLSDSSSYEYAINLINQLSKLRLTNPITVDMLNYDEVFAFKTRFLNSANVIGASGAVFGILLAFGMMWPNSVVYLNFLFPVKVKYLVIIMGAYALYSGFNPSAYDNVAHFAHLGGMLFGFILLKYWNVKRLN